MKKKDLLKVLAEIASQYKTSNINAVEMINQFSKEIDNYDDKKRFFY